jgi:hypothetical protein
VRAFLITALRCLVTFVLAAVAAIGAAMLTSQLVTLAYRAYYRVPVGLNIIEDYRYVTYHTLIVLPIFVGVLFVACRYVWHWSRRFQPM